MDNDIAWWYVHRKQRNGATFESEPAKVAPASPGDPGSVPVAASAPVSASHSPQAAAHTYSNREHVCTQWGSKNESESTNTWRQ